MAVTDRDQPNQDPVAERARLRALVASRARARLPPLSPDPAAGLGAPGEARGSVVIGALCAWDVLAALSTLWLSGAFGRDGARAFAVVPMALLAAVTLSAAGAYRPQSWLREHPIEMLGGLSVAATVVAWAAVVTTALISARPHLGALIAAWLVLPIGWYAARRVAGLAWRRRRPERTLIIGGGEVARRVLALARRSGAVVIGCLDDGEGTLPGVPCLGAIEELPEVLAGREIDRLVFAFSARRDHEILEVLRSCTSFPGTIDIVPRFFDFVGSTATVYNTDGLPFLSIPARRLTRGRALAKRVIDLAGAAILTIVLSPLLCFIALAIVLDSGAPVLFRQRRIGLHGRSFMIVKFRTLAPCPDPGPPLPALELTPESIALHVERAKQEAVSRATRVGSILRRTSLDELPQLFNVLAGHMSLVGPRPLSALEDASLDGWELLRREVRPGITGLWQVSGRSEVSWEERINLDYRQVRHWSLYSDIQVLADTIGAVLRQRGAE